METECKQTGYKCLTHRHRRRGWQYFASIAMGVEYNVRVAVTDHGRLKVLARTPCFRFFLEGFLQPVQILCTTFMSSSYCKCVICSAADFNLNNNLLRTT